MGSEARYDDDAVLTANIEAFVEYIGVASFLRDVVTVKNSSNITYITTNDASIV